MLTTNVAKWLGVAVLGAAGFGAAEVVAQQVDPDQAFQAPANSKALTATGKLEAMRGNVLQFRDSEDAIWYVQVNAQTKVEIAGEAKLDYLRPGMLVELQGKINGDGEFDEPIAELEVINSKGRPTLGLFDVADDAQNAKPVREPAPGEYRVRARLIGVKDDELKMVAGRLKLNAKAAEDLKVVLAVDDPGLAQPGDDMKLKAWYYEMAKPTMQQPGRALAESISITLANPPVANKRGR